MKNIKHFNAHLALAAATLLFGANYWIAKGMMPGYFSPSQIVFLRLTGSVALFWLFYAFSAKQQVARRDLIRMAICGLLGVSLNQMFFFHGLNLSSPVDVSIIGVVNPLAVMVFAALIIRERTGPLKVLGVLTGAAGALIIVLYGSNAAFDPDHMLGNVFIVINTLFYALYMVLMKPLLKKYPTATVMAWVFTFGFIIVIPFTIQDVLQLEWTLLPRVAWLSLLYVVAGTTFLAYLLTSHALKFLDATVVGFYSYFQPMMVVIIGLIMFREQFTVLKLVAAIMIFAGVYLVNRRTKANV